MLQYRRTPTVYCTAADERLKYSAKHMAEWNQAERQGSVNKIERGDDATGI